MRTEAGWTWWTRKASCSRSSSRPPTCRTATGRGYWPHLALVWADAGYAGPVAEDLRQQLGWTLAVVKRSDLQPRNAFAVQPHRWIIEWTFSWWADYAA